MQTNNYTVEDLICNESFQLYCTGKDPEAVGYWRNWIANDPARMQQAGEAARIIMLLNGNQGNLQQQLAQIKDGINRFDLLKLAVNQTGEKTPAIGKKKIFRYAAIAASILILLTAATLIYFANPETIPTQPANKMITISAVQEPRKTVILPDGSVVTLRKNSTIRFSENFNQSHRDIDFSGEAFFDVSHNPGIPFIVHTKDVNIEVLGTVFNISAYPGSAHTETSLFRGKVAVSPRARPDDKVILTPNKKLVFLTEAAAANKVSAKQVKIAPLTADPVSHKAQEIAWIRNRLKIDDEPLSAIAKKLQEWYGIRIVFKDEEVKTYRYSGTFETETVVKALEALQLSYPFSFQIENEIIVIRR